MRQRVHISGGDAVANLALAAAAGGRRLDAASTAAVLAHLGFQPGPLAHLPAPRWPSNDNGRVVVGVDITQLPNTDGSPAKVEWLPLTATAGKDIAAAASFDFELKPYKYARPGPLVLDSTIASNLVMTNLQIGGKPIFAGNGCVPCVLFSQLSIQNALSSLIASNNAPITFTLTNIHASATQTVRGVWVCDTSELNVGG
jgi:hypothetical protein